MSDFLTPDQYKVAGSTVKYETVLSDLDGIPIGSGSVSAMTLSIIDVATGAHVNQSGAESVLNTGRGTLDVSGNLVITLAPADTAIKTSGNAFEVRKLIITFTFGADIGIIPVIFAVKAA